MTTNKSVLFLLASVAMQKKREQHMQGKIINENFGNKRKENE